MKPARIHCETVLDSPMEAVVDAIMRPRSMQIVARPLVSIRVADGGGFPEMWDEGVYEAKIALFGFIPLGRQWISVAFEESEDPNVMRGRDKGWSDLVDSWDHRIMVKRLDERSTLYSDTVVIDAGAMTWPTALFSKILFRHRQRRLRALARRGFPLDEA